MSLELVAGIIAPWLGEWMTVKIAEAVLGGVNTQLKQQDLDKALKTCVAKADDQVKLFWRCEPRYIPKFLDSVFKDAVEELQKPFKNQGTPQVDYFLEVFKKSLEEHPKIKQNINESLIKPWLDIFVKNYFEVTNAYLRFKITKEAYLKQIANYFDDVKFAGIAVEGQEVDKSAQLPQIFVMPDVVEDMRERNLTDEKDFVFLDANLEASGISKRQAELLQQQRQIGRLEKSTGKNFSAQKLLTESTSQKFVLLGAPGSGKTTLLSYFAVMLAQKQPEILGLAAETDLLPIIIKIRDLAKRAEHLSILDYIRQFATGNLQVKELPTGFFEYWLDDGRALILLDGLDEVANKAKRDEIVNQIEAFLSQYPQNRTIITSRPAGYKRAFFRAEEFPRYALESFDDTKIEIFVKKWYESRFEDPEESQSRQESLRQALAEQKRIKELARNPLLLTIIALIHRYEAYLPRQRHKLYDRAVKTLLTNWDAGKELNYKLPCEYLHHDDIERLMQQLAYWIHTQGGTGDKEGGTLIDKEELIKQLKQFIAEEKSIKPHQAEKEAERFVAHIQERAGLLNEQGQDCYAFVHKTFQEYLAAQEIKDRQEGDGDEVVLEHIEKYLHNPHWREVLLLLIAQQHRKKTAKFLNHILEQDTLYEQWVHRNLFFAASCLAEDLEVQDESVAQQILQQLVNLEISDDGRVGAKIREQVFKSFSSLNESRFEAQALQLLKDSAQHIDEKRLQKYRVALGEKEEVIKILIARLADEDSSVRRNAADALGKLGNASEQVVNALLGRLADEDSWVRGNAASALGKLGNASEQVVNALLGRLADEDSWVRGNAAAALGKLGNASEQVVNALLGRLADEDSWVRGYAADALGKLGNASEQVVNALLGRLADKDSSVRGYAASALGNLGNASEQVVNALLGRLADKDSSVRVFAASALGNLGNASEQVVNALLGRLADEDSSVRVFAASALGNLGKNSGDVATTVVEWVSQHQDSEYVGSGIDVLWELVATDG
ncbi:sister chromatid cohesion protein PDS5 [Scytonema sp. HK-05]|uniref:sister chromatid cohesion protein PDS5 n=1 Tax=Scytonema sp. HK-05 TaxID=1137095 RepID=UPI0009357A72|nr:sister chromatid cohesion protein PDS5 [Scytonema sp. HK-05]OKH57182.1 signal transduction protein [Scytonema sp. HK-05]